jgi:hypothetical protein
MEMLYHLCVCVCVYIYMCYVYTYIYINTGIFTQSVRSCKRIVFFSFFINKLLLIAETNKKKSTD